MSDDPATNPTPTQLHPTDEHKPETPVDDNHPHEPAAAHEPVQAAGLDHQPETDSNAEPGSVPQAEAGVEGVTEPDPEHAAEPEPAPPPEIAEVQAATGESFVTADSHAGHSSTHGEDAEQAPVSESAGAAPEAHAEELVPLPETYREEESHEVTYELANAPAQPAAEHPAEQEAAETPQPGEPAAEAPHQAAEAEPPAKAPAAKRTKKKPAAAATPASTAGDAQAAEPTPAEAPTPAVTPSGVAGEPAPENKKKWYAIKVQSGREESIKAAILRKVAIEGLEEFLGRIEIPVEEVVEKKQVRVKDKKTGDYTYQEKKVTKKKKKFHGYIFGELEFNDRILYLFRETSGVGDFLNMRGKPPVPEPMPEHEVQAMLTGVAAKPGIKGGKVKHKLDFEKGDRVRIRDGSFANQEGEVKAITEPKDPTDSPKVTIELTFWGRPLDVELDYWQVDKV